MQALLYDGRTSAGQAVEIRLQSWGVLQLIDGRQRRSWNIDDLAVADRVGDCAAVIELPDGGRLEVTDAEDFYAAYAQLGGSSKHWLHWLEGRWTTVLACLVLIVGLTAWALTDGLPLAARVVADLMPQSAQQAIGREGAEILDSYLFEPSELSAERQVALRAVFEDVLTDVGDGGNYELRFRRSEALGANAIALPAGIVFLTDELVALAENDQELAAVLAHELGHVLNHHALRALLQNSVAAGFIVAITGDLGSAANLAAGIPTLLLNAAYSRDFEREADEVAYAYLRQNDIDPRRLGELLLRVDQRYGRDSGETSLLSTHPGALERLEGALAETAPEAE